MIIVNKRNYQKNEKYNDDIIKVKHEILQYIYINEENLIENTRYAFSGLKNFTYRTVN